MYAAKKNVITVNKLLICFATPMLCDVLDDSVKQ